LFNHVRTSTVPAMKTALNLNNRVMRLAKEQVAREGITRTACGGIWWQAAVPAATEDRDRGQATQRRYLGQGSALRRDRPRAIAVESSTQI